MRPKCTLLGGLCDGTRPKAMVKNEKLLLRIEDTVVTETSATIS